MKIIEIDKIERLNDVNVEDPHWKDVVVSHILTVLARMPSGCIVAEWSKSTTVLKWLFSTEPCVSRWPESTEGVLLTTDNVVTFRSLLGALGMFILNEVYWGAGTFRVRFKTEDVLSTLLGMIFSNQRATGYWIKLFVVPDWEPEE